MTPSSVHFYNMQFNIIIKENQRQFPVTFLPYHTGAANNLFGIEIECVVLVEA